MALGNDDLIVVQKSGGGELRKSTVSGLLALNTSANDGQINIDGGDGITASGDNATANQAGNTTRTLSVDETWLSGWLPANYPHTVPGDGNINISGGDGITATGQNAKANQTGDTTRTLAVDTAWLGTWLGTNYPIPPSPWTEDSGKLYPTTLTNNVGIGTDSPTQKLEVVSDASTLVRVTSADSGGSFIDLGKASTPTGGRIGYDPGNNLLFCTESTEKVRIKSNGNVGIGTDSPSNKLTVVGNADAASAAPSNFTSSIYTNTAELNFGAVSGFPAIQGSGSGTSFHVLLNPLAGNVGIGTESPAEKLHVEGTTKSKQFDATVAPNGGDAAYRSRLTGGANAFHMYCDMDGGGLIALRSNGQITAQGYDIEALPTLP